MKLSEIDDNNLSDEDVSNIVYTNIEDNKIPSKYALVFGNSLLINERVKKAVEIYKEHRIEKLIFLGGTKGVSNQEHSKIPEAEKMKKLALELGVNEKDILIDNTSKNTFENVENALKIIGNEIKQIDNITIITSEYHLKRCYAVLKKKYPNIGITLVCAKDGFTDSENWFLSEDGWNTGRGIVTYEAHLLIKYAKENKIEDLQINIDNNKKISIR